MSEVPNISTPESTTELMDEELIPDALGMLQQQLLLGKKKEVSANIDRLILAVKIDLVNVGGATQKDLGGLLENIINTQTSGNSVTSNTPPQGQDVIKSIATGLILQKTEEEYTQDARDIVYTMLTEKSNQKKDFMKNIFGNGGIWGRVKSFFAEKILGDQKKAEDVKQEQITTLKGKYASQIAELKNTLGIATGSTATPTQSIDALSEYADWNNDKDSGVDDDELDRDYKYDPTHYQEFLKMNPQDARVLGNMKSYPIIQKSAEGKTMTYCARSARQELDKYFGIKAKPGGSAMEVMKAYTKKEGNITDIYTIEKNTLPTMDNLKGDVFQLFTSSNKHPQYGHTFWGFRSYPSGKVYVMDYYIKGADHKKPMLLEDYHKQVCVGMNRPMLKIVGYDTEKKVVDSEQALALIITTPKQGKQTT